MSFKTNPRWMDLAVVACTLTLLVGCTSGKSEGWKFADGWDVRKAIGMKPEDPNPPQVPNRLVSSWTQTIHHRSGETPKRGFGGRLVFFNKESETPVRVAGRLVVYAFDEGNREPHETHPTRRFIFPPEQFVRHESDSKLGPSYSVWLPWDEVGGPQKNISLIARFEPSEGSLIVGEQTRHLLPGALSDDMRETMLAGKQKLNDVQLAGYNQKNTPEEKPNLQMSTATFAVPSRLGESLSKPQKLKRPAPLSTAGAVPLPSTLPAASSAAANSTSGSDSVGPGRQSIRTRALKDSLLQTLQAQ